MKQRLANVKKQLQSLATHQAAVTNLTGGTVISAKREPTVSFQISDAVNAYANAIQPKLIGGAAFDSDFNAQNYTAENETAADAGDNRIHTCITRRSSASTDGRETPESNFMGFAHDVLGPDYSELFSGTLVASTSPATQTTPSVSTAAPTLTEPISTPSQSSLLFSAGQMQGRAFFPTSDARKRSKPSDNYYISKTNIIAVENLRRQQWHDANMAIKNAELAIKNEQLNVWKIVARTLEQNPSMLGEAARLLAPMQSNALSTNETNVYPQYTIPNSSQSDIRIDLDAAEAIDNQTEDEN